MERSSFPRWPLVSLRRVIDRVEQGWSPVAADEPLEGEGWGVIKLSAIRHGKFSADEHKALLPDTEQIRNLEIRAGDVLLTRANTPDLVGDACFVECTRPHLMLSDLVYRLVTRQDRVDPRFLTYSLLSVPLRDQIVRDARGSSQSMVKVGQSHIKNWLIALPDMSIQRAVAAFLNRKTAAIDALIAKKERLIDLLHEERLAWVTRVVTKGLDSSATSKDSGIYWLGAIPAHWEIARNGSLFLEIDERRRGDLPVLSVSLVSGVRERDFSEERIQPKMSDFEQYKVARRGDVVFNKMRMWQGAVGAAPVDGLVSPDYTVLRPRDHANPRFFSEVFRTRGYMCEVNRYSHGIALDRNRIYWDSFKSILSPVPPRREQDEIVEEIDRLTSENAARVHLLKRGVDLMAEYRQALISAAVTGKLDIAEEGAA